MQKHNINKKENNMARGRFTQPLDMYHTNYNADITGIRPHWRMNINSGHTLTYNTWTN